MKSKVRKRDAEGKEEQLRGREEREEREEREVERREEREEREEKEEREEREERREIKGQNEYKIQQHPQGPTPQSSGSSSPNTPPP